MGFSSLGRKWGQEKGKEAKTILILRSRRSGAEAWGCVKLECAHKSTKPPRAPRVASV